MAEKVTEPSAEDTGKGSKKLLLIIGVLLLVAINGVGSFFALKDSKGGGEGEEDDEDQAVESAASALPSAVLPLETFIVNLQVKGSFLKMTIQLEFAEPELPRTIERDIPRIRDAVIRLASSKPAADILSAAGKDKLREELRDGINDVLGADDVTDLYFTEFIIQ